MIVSRRLVAVAVLSALALVAVRAGPASATNDTFFSRQWALEQIKAPQAWTRSTGSGVTIGIVEASTATDICAPPVIAFRAGNSRRLFSHHERRRIVAARQNPDRGLTGHRGNSKP